MKSVDKGWNYYADAFEVLAPDGALLGRRELAHPHESDLLLEIEEDFAARMAALLALAVERRLPVGDLGVFPRGRLHCSCCAGERSPGRCTEQGRHRR